LVDRMAWTAVTGIMKKAHSRKKEIHMRVTRPERSQDRILHHNIRYSSINQEKKHCSLRTREQCGKLGIAHCNPCAGHMKVGDMAFVPFFCITYPRFDHRTSCTRGAAWHLHVVRSSLISAPPATTCAVRFLKVTNAEGNAWRRAFSCSS